MHILIDLDGTLLDWGARWDQALEEHYPHLTNIPRTKDQRSFDLKINLTPEEQNAVDHIFDLEEFYRDLEPLPGAVEAFHAMVDAGHHVQIATSPWWTNPTCLQDKANSVLKYFGDKARKEMSFITNKTLLRGDILFDDKPEIHPLFEEPEWVQVLYDQPYNRHVNKPRIFDWSEWEEAIERVREKTYAGRIAG